MSYRVLLAARAQKQMDKLPIEVLRRVDPAILALEHNPRPRKCKKLAGREGWRLRVGDFRIVYQINDDEKWVLITDVVDRKDVYR